MKMEDFAQRYRVAADPRGALQAAPPRMREAIQAGKLMLGMTRAQALLAIGYPITSYTANLDAPLWRYWADRSSEFQIFWTDDGRIDKVFGSPEVRARVVAE